MFISSWSITIAISQAMKISLSERLLSRDCFVSGCCGKSERDLGVRGRIQSPKSSALVGV